MQALMNYFQAVLADGDYLNDWLTHLPAWAQPSVETVGHAVYVVGHIINHI